MGGPGPIPLSEIETFLRLYEIEDKDWWVRLVCKLDHAYLEYYAKKQEAKNLSHKGVVK